MSKLYLYIICIICLLCSSCRPHPSDSRLSEAGILVETYPDSALKLLNAIDTSTLHAESDRAYYALLLTRARDKTYVMQTDDSLILTAVAYYKSTHNVPLLARSYYQLGGIYRDANHCEQAIYAYSMALEHAGQDTALIERIYLNIGYQCCNQGLNQKADSAFALSAKMAIALKDSSMFCECLAMQGRINMLQNKTQDAETYLAKAYQVAKANAYTSIRRKVTAELSNLYSRKKEADQSLRFAKEHFSLLTDSSYYPLGHLHMGNAYYFCGRYDSARWHLRRCVELTKSYGIKADAYMRLADVAYKQGLLNEAVTYERRYSAYLDSANHKRQDVGIIKGELKAKNETLKHNFEAEQKKFTPAIWVIISLCCILFVVFLLKKKAHHKAKETNAPKKTDALLSEEINEMINKRNSLARENYESSQVFKKMTQIINQHKKFEKSDISLCPSDWHDLIVETDRRWNQITLHLQTDYMLTPDEIKVCCLYLTDFPTSHLQYILNCSRDTVYKKGYQILENRIGQSRKQISLKDFLRHYSQEKGLDHN